MLSSSRDATLFFAYLDVGRTVPLLSLLARVFIEHSYGKELVDPANCRKCRIQYNML